MQKLISEIFEEVNVDPSKLENYKSNAVVKLIFKHAFEESAKFILPDGDPPYRQDAAPTGLSPSNLYMEARRLYVFCRADLKPLKRESLFISMLESLDGKEAKLLLAVKDQNLEKLYPNITKEYVLKIFGSL